MLKLHNLICLHQVIYQQALCNTVLQVDRVILTINNTVNEDESTADLSHLWKNGNL